MISDFYNQMDKMPTKSAVKMIGMGDKIAKTLGVFGK
jgi:hypothetical protein